MLGLKKYFKKFKRLVGKATSGESQASAVKQAHGLGEPGAGSVKPAQLPGKASSCCRLGAPLELARWELLHPLVQ